MAQNVFTLLFDFLENNCWHNFSTQCDATRFESDLKCVKLRQMRLYWGRLALHSLEAAAPSWRLCSAEEKSDSSRKAHFIWKAVPLSTSPLYFLQRIKKEENFLGSIFHRTTSSELYWWSQVLKGGHERVAFDSLPLWSLSLLGHRQGESTLCHFFTILSVALRF